MRSHLDYFFTATEYSLTELGNIVYEKVFRKDFSEPGFVVIDYGLNFTSEKLRESMVNLKRQLSDIHVKRVGQKLLYQWMGRFDEGQVVVLFNGFQKKTLKTPKNEIEKAQRLKKEYFELKNNKHEKGSHKKR